MTTLIFRFLYDFSSQLLAARFFFEWDPVKAVGNERKHGVRFEVATLVFDDPNVLEVDATRGADGEVRTKAIGRIDGYLMSVLFTMRSGSVRLISARRANPREERLYVDRPLQT